MRLTIERASLLARLNRAKGILQTRNTVPILGCVRLVAEAGALALTTTSLKARYDASLPAAVERPGRTAVDAHRLAGLVSLLTAAEVTLDQEAPAAPIILRAGRARYSIPTLPAEDFPEMTLPASGGGFVIWPDALCDAIVRVGHAMAVDMPDKIYLCGMQIYLRDGRIDVAASDGHRGAIWSVPEAHVEVGGAFEGVILPEAIVSTVAALAKDGDEKIEVTVGTDRIRFARPGESLTSLLVDATRLDIRRVIPADRPHAVTIEPERILPALKRLESLFADKTKRIEIDVAGGVMTLKGRDGVSGADGGEEVEVSAEGGDCATSLNVRYLIAAIAAAPGPHVVMRFGNPFDAPRFDAVADPDWAAVIMPMRG